MELLYVWIRKYHNIQNQEFNFSKKYTCEFYENQNINVDIKQDAISEDFFKIKSNISSQECGQIINITGIIGENGTGKSSILDYIIERVNSFILGDFHKNEKDEQMIAIVKEGDTLSIYVSSIIVKKILIKDPSLKYEIISNTIKSSSNNYKLIYYSNIFDAKKEHHTNSNIIDISTNHLLKKEDNYRLSEIQRQLNLIVSDIKVKLPFKYPDFLNCSFSPFYYLSEIVQPVDPYDFENIVFEVFSNYFDTGTWRRENWNSGAGFDMYNSETHSIINCVYKEYDSGNTNTSKKYREVYEKVKNDIRKYINRGADYYGNISFLKDSKIHSDLDNINQYIVVTNLPYNLSEEFLFKEKIDKEFEHSIEIHIYFWDKIVELIESTPKIRQAYFKYKKVKEKVKLDMLEYIPANKELQIFRRLAFEELNGASPYEQLKIRICLCYFFVFYRTNHEDETFKNNWENPYIGEFLEGKLGTVDTIIKMFVAYESSNGVTESKLGNFIECLDKLVRENLVLIDKTGEGFKISLEEKKMQGYKQLILEAYNESQEVFTKGFDFLEFDWYDMSSGQKAMFNIMSRFYNARELIGTSENLLILIDEGETYFHPEWQRRYIYLLLEALPRIFTEKKIQIIFTSNTPLVISDLPRENIVFLKSIEGLCQVQENDEFRETFGANIHILLSDSFFMKNDIIGKFAREKIDYIINLLNNDDEGFKRDVIENKINLRKLKKEISIIGEALIRNKLLDMYTRKVNRLGLEEDVLKENKNEIIDLQQMTNEDLQRFKKDIENVLLERKINDKSKD